jgi:hypothetical protein
MQGALIDHVECSNTAKRLSDLASGVQQSLNDLGALGNLSEDSKTLKVICIRCIRISEELSGRLNDLRVSGKHRKWASFRQALKTVWSTDKVDDLAHKLASCKEELNLHLVDSIRYAITLFTSPPILWATYLYVCRRKADSLAIQQQETAEAVRETAQRTVETILEAREILQRDIKERHGTSDSLFLQQSSAPSSTLVSLGEAQSVEIDLLLSLRFLTIDDRYVAIPEAHKKTFQWIFKDSDHGQPWSNFSHWLRSGEGIYWINGKAGSGKSTMMRYIFDNPQATRDLEIWAGTHPLETYGFFFWSSGTSEQRSLVGLLRSLLYHAIRKRPHTVRYIFPEEITSALARRHDEEWNWTLQSLQLAFKRWANATCESGLRVCLFLDGLDEYDGDHEAIVDFFKSLTLRYPPQVKIGISSRPWVVFDDAFRGLPGLRLQDLTYSDIERYVEDKLEAHPNMQRLSQADPAHASDLVTDIVKKASGVFLWVMLIVRSLLTGLRNRDDILVLQKRLQDFPADLNSLYTQMLDHVEPLYNEQASMAFQIFGALSDEKGKDTDAVTALELDLAITATPDRFPSITSAPMIDEEVHSICEHLDVYLKTRCAGLLEIHTGKRWSSDWEKDPKLAESVYGSICKPEDIRYFDALKPTHKVNYLHRTVRDFLNTEDVRAKLLEDVKSDFNPNTWVIRSCAIRLKRSIFLSHLGFVCPPSNTEIWAMVIRAMKYAKEAELSGDETYVDAFGCARGSRPWSLDIHS